MYTEHSSQEEEGRDIQWRVMDANRGQEPTRRAGSIQCPCPRPWNDRAPASFIQAIPYPQTGSYPQPNLAENVHSCQHSHVTCTSTGMRWASQTRSNGVFAYHRPCPEFYPRLQV